MDVTQDTWPDRHRQTDIDTIAGQTGTNRDTIDAQAGTDRQTNRDTIARLTVTDRQTYRLIGDWFGSRQELFPSHMLQVLWLRVSQARRDGKVRFHGPLNFMCIRLCVYCMFVQWLAAESVPLWNCTQCVWFIWAGLRLWAYCIPARYEHHGASLSPPSQSVDVFISFVSRLCS